MNNSAKDVTPAKNAGLVSFFQKTYLYMALALVVTALTSWVMATFFTEATIRILGSFGIFGAIALFALQMVLVVVIQRSSTNNPARAFGLLLAFSVLNGVTLSSIFLFFTTASLVTTFLSAAAMFAGMAAYGLITKRDLSGMAPILFGVLIGFIVAALANLFLHSGTLQFILSFVGVILFSAYTAYDNNRLKNIYFQLEGRVNDMTGIAVSGALSLYLDFINLFTSLLQFTGSSRN